MKAQFLSYITQYLPFIKHTKLLLAVSGGLDRMVLFALCNDLELDMAIAHCNFNLRGEESDAETTFVEKTMQEAQIPIFIKHFDTSAFAKEKKISTQMAARDLRYTWFQELASKHDFEYILTAHHSNDAAETFLINLGRGTGIKGLTGIPRHNGNVVRPLLGFSRKQIKEYADSAHLLWREDSSNASDNYLRNDLRNNAIPILEKASPHFLEGLTKTQENLKQSAALLNTYVAQLKQEYTYPINSIQGSSGICIDLEKLAAHPEQDAVLYTLLEGYGFTAWQDVYDLKQAQSGKKILSQTHSLYKDRTVLQLMPIDNKKKAQVVWVSANEKQVQLGGGQLALEVVAKLETASRNEIFVAKDRLKFPLHIRSWQEGDYFFPLGLKGKKKLSKFFKDEKLSLVQKKEVQILCSGEEIVWIVGMRPDDRFKVNPDTKSILKISYTNYEV